MTASGLTPFGETFVRDHWIPALLSGAFLQTSDQLRFGDEYCCLGVACELLYDKVESPIELTRAPVGSGDYSLRSYEYNHQSQVLPHEVSDLLGISPSGYIVWTETNNITALTLMNDGSYEFSDIAHVLEDVLNPDAPLRFMSNEEFTDHFVNHRENQTFHLLDADVINDMRHHALERRTVTANV